MPNFLQISFNTPAWLIAWSFDSIEHGPAIKKKGWILETSNSDILIMFWF